MTAIVAVILCPFALLTAFFLVEVLSGLPRGRSKAATAGASAVVVVPAHDEALVIGQTLERLNESVGPNMRVLVIADNCTDATADRARELGVEVIERNDPVRRGKGYALAFAAEHLASDPPDVFVVLDADCAIDRDSLQALVASAGSGTPSQTINLLRPDPKGSPLVQLSTFAFVLKNLVRQRGLQRLAGRVHLTGTGMAMPYGLFRASSEVRSSIVEDLALGLELADRGHPPRLVTDAIVWSGGSTEEGTLIQRRRWEGGFLATSLRYAPRLVGRSLMHGNMRGVLAGLDLFIPPLALFALLNVMVLLIAAALTFASDARWWPVIAQTVLLALAGLAVFVAWQREGRQFVSLGVLARVPLYVLWKIPLYLGLARRGAPVEWLRTGR